MQCKEAIVLAGGLGTRLQGVISDVPKCMAPVAGRPFLEYILDQLIGQGIEHVVLSVGYLRDTIIDHLGITYKSLSLDYAIEDTPLGTGGALHFATQILHEDLAFILNGDTFFEVSLPTLADHYRQTHADVALVLKNVPNAGRFGNVMLDENNRITAFLEKTNRNEAGLINGGIYLFNRQCFKKFPVPEKFSLERDFFEKYLNDLHLTGFVSEGQFIDIGIPEDYYEAQKLFSRTY